METFFYIILGIGFFFAGCVVVIWLLKKKKPEVKQVENQTSWLRDLQQRGCEPGDHIFNPPNYRCICGAEVVEVQKAFFEQETKTGGQSCGATMRQIVAKQDLGSTLTASQQVELEKAFSNKKIKEDK